MGSNEADPRFVGKLFELNLYLLLLHQGCRNNICQFKLHREKKDVGCFDDLVMEFQEKRETFYRVFQAKHTIKPEKKKITEKLLLSNAGGDFDLIKYFTSYLKANEKYLGKIRDFVICTNMRFDDSMKNNISEITDGDTIFNVVKKNKESFKRYHITEQKFIKKFTDEWEKRMKVTKNDAQSKKVKAEIVHFFKSLTFAINMPIENDLCEIIKNEIGVNFNDWAKEHIYNKAFAHMMDWMKGKDKKPFWTLKDAEDMFDAVKKDFLQPVQYNVKPPIGVFANREKELVRINGLIDKRKPVVVHGLGGVGKSELVREYIKNYKKKYKNILWIDAKNNVTLEKSFRTLASSKLNIETKDANGEDKEISGIIEEVYEKLQENKSLFVFDNAEWDDYRNYMRPSLSENARQPNFIIISRSRWVIRNSISFMYLSDLEESSAIDFISNSLPEVLEDKPQSDSDKKLGKTLQCFPLALQQACAYINTEYKHVTETNKWNKYIKDLPNDYLKYLDYGICNYCENKYNLTVWSTWDDTIKALDDTIKGPKENFTSKVLNYMSFLDINSIDAKVLSKCFNHEEQLSLEKSIQLLDRHSFITTRSKDVYSLHGLVKLVIIEKLRLHETKYKEDLEHVLRATQNETISPRNSHTTSLINHLKNLKV